MWDNFSGELLDSAMEKALEIAGEISAENFVKRVYEYYLDLTISKDFHNDLNGEDSTMKRLTRMVTHLPTKAITLPVNGSVRIIKGSAKQVKKIRNIKKFLD